MSESARLPQTIASALGIGEQPGRPLMDTSLDALSVQEMLLLLDNCEHLLPACADMAEHLLQACPSVRIMATSREPLDIPGETIWRVPSLSFPPAAATDAVDTAAATAIASPDSLCQYEAIQLFVERARSSLPDFALTAALSKSPAALATTSSS